MTPSGPINRTATVLVTGAAGFIGSHLVDALLEEGWNVIGVDDLGRPREHRSRQQNLAAHLRHPAYRLARGDITNMSFLEKEIPEKPQIVVHLASRTDPMEDVQKPDQAIQANLQGTLNMLEFSRRRRVPQFVFGSCGTAYGVASGLPWKEETITLPLNAFTASLGAAEQFGHCYSRLYGVRFVAARLFEVYGPRQGPESLLSRMCESIITGQPVKLAGDLAAQREWTYVTDAVQGLRLAMSYGVGPFATFNIGGGRPVPMSELIEDLELLLGIKATISTIARQQWELLDAWATTEKARRMLGFQPRVSLHAGLREFLAWYTSKGRQLAASRDSAAGPKRKGGGTTRRRR